MIGLWIMLIATSSVEEFDTRPVEIILHITAELLTGILLIISAVMMWRGRAIRYSLFFLSMGMLFYTSIVSPGYYADKGDWPIVIGFGVMLTFGVILAGSMLFSLLKSKKMAASISKS